MRFFTVIAVAILPIASLTAQTSPSVWRLSQPLVTIGSQSGPVVFGNVVGALRQSTGVIVVADGMSRQLRFFSPTGVPLRTVGRSGSGPGEFQHIKAMQRCRGDSTFVYDPLSLKIEVFDPDGSRARGIDIRKWAAMGLPPYEFSCNDAGVFAFVQRDAVIPRILGPRRASLAITVVQADGRVVNLGSFPASERYVIETGDMPRPLGIETSVAIGRRSVYVGTGDYVGAGNAVEVKTFSFGGQSMTSIRGVRPRVAVTRKHVNQYIALKVANASAGTNPVLLERAYRDMEYPEVFPAYASLMVDGSENIWMEGFPIPGRSVRDWMVFSRSGATVATLRVPSNLRIVEVGTDYVLGVWRDAVNVDFVKMYSLIK